MEFLQVICDSEDISLHEYPFKSNLRGVAMKLDDMRSIGYDDKLTGWPQIAVIAHELGHHFLGHLDDDKLKGEYLDCEEHKRIRERREQEAQVFAAVFTARALYDYYKKAVSL